MAVYFVQAGVFGPIKIGHTDSDPQKRIATIQTAHHEKLRLLACVQGSRADERALHQRFAEFRLHGEWFQASPELLDCIATSKRISEQTGDVVAAPSYEDTLRAMMSRGRMSSKRGEWFIQNYKKRRFLPEEVPKDGPEDWDEMRAKSALWEPTEKAA